MTGPILRRSEAPVLIGRADELRALLGAMAHPPSVALVEGEAGIGKTRLVREALRHPAVASRRVLVGVCHPLREPFPYGPVFDLLRSVEDAVPAGLNPVCGALRPYLPELAAHLPAAPEPLADPLARQHCLFRAVRALLSALGPVVVVVEDLHWADDGTRDLLQFLVDAPPQGTSLVLSYRREDLPGNGLPLGRAYRHPLGADVVLIPLAPLDTAGVRGLATAITGGETSARFAVELHRRTAGIPFVVEEVVRSLHKDASGRLPRQVREAGPEELDAIGVPTLLHEAMTERLAALSQETLACVRAVAVLGVPTGEAVVGAVAGVPEERVADRIREALLAGVVFEVGEDLYGFRHALAQQAVYRTVPGVDRRRLHRRAMEVLVSVQPPPLVLLAHHARRAGESAAWARYAEAAARTAQTVGDTALVVQILEEMLSAPELLAQDRYRLATELSRAAVIGLSYRRAVRLLRRVIRDEAMPDEVRGEIRLNLGLLLYNQAGDYEQGHADIEGAVAELTRRPALAARAMAALAMPHWGDYPYQAHQRWIDQAEELVAHEEDPGAKVAVRGNHLALRLYRGDPTVWAEIEVLMRSDGTVAERVQLARTSGNLAECAAWLGHYAAAQSFHQEGRRLAAECGAPYYEGMIDSTGLCLEWNQGQWHGLDVRAERVLETVPESSSVAADAQLVLGLLALARGEWDLADGRLAAAGLADDANAPGPTLAVACAAMVQVRLAMDEVEAAQTLARRGMERIRRKGIWAWGADLAPAAVTALLRGGHGARAEQLTEEFADGLAGCDAPLAMAGLLVCRGFIAQGRGEPAAAVRAFTEGGSAYAALPRPYASFWAFEAAARCRLLAGDSSATTELARLTEQFTALGATRDAARCRMLLRGSGFSPVSRRGRRGYGDRLSPREREVGRLMVLGRTNREIAEVLFLSPRTVEQHVSKVLRKLNLTSRGDVTASLLDTAEADITQTTLS
ncbi:ATP-binding protein [Streptomyces mutabilis]|uniref:ATP-binding protein n=1 Tax=Streptomyces mutabilis TaxID=67332 RepID=UPI0036B390B5